MTDWFFRIPRKLTAQPKSTTTLVSLFRHVGRLKTPLLGNTTTPVWKSTIHDKALPNTDSGMQFVWAKTSAQPAYPAPIHYPACRSAGGFMMCSAKGFIGTLSYARLIDGEVLRILNSPPDHTKSVFPLVLVLTELRLPNYGKNFLCFGASPTKKDPGVSSRGF